MTSVADGMSRGRRNYVVKFHLLVKGKAGCIKRFESRLHVEDDTDFAQGDQPGKSCESVEQKWYLWEKERQENYFRGKLALLLLAPDKGSEGESSVYRTVKEAILCLKIFFPFL